MKLGKERLNKIINCLLNVGMSELLIGVLAYFRGDFYEGSPILQAWGVLSAALIFAWFLFLGIDYVRELRERRKK